MLHTLHNQRNDCKLSYIRFDNSQRLPTYNNLLGMIYEGHFYAVELGCFPSNVEFMVP